MGLELDEPKLGAFAGSLNALDFPVQLLVGQHPPVLQGLAYEKLDEAHPDDLPEQTRDAANSLGRLLANAGDPRGHPGPAVLCRLRAQPHGRTARPVGTGRPGGLSPGRREPLRLFWLSAALGGSPVETG